MVSLLVSVLSFIVALGVLIAIHEYGHFWVARKVGVKVLRFSIGFGKPIWQRNFGDDKTEFVLAAIPLGGYVKMLDERVEPVEEHELDRAFNRKTLGQRMAVVIAGPLANFMFAIVAYWLLFVIGIPGIKPIVDDVQQNSPFAMAGLMTGDEILSVAGAETPTLQSVRMQIIDEILSQSLVDIKVQSSGGVARTIQLDLTETPVDAISGNLLQYLGFTPYRPKLAPIVDTVSPGSAAEAAGILAGDEIIEVDGVLSDDWVAWANYIRERPEKVVNITLIRDGLTLNLDVVPAKIEMQNGVIGRVGLSPFVPEDFYQDMMATQHYGVIKSIGAAIEKTYDMSLLTLKMFGKMITGQASLENISGPISIAQYAGQSAQIGLLSFISFMAIISISLGVLNLLPIPLLDGGHLMYYIVEFFKGSAVSDEAQLFGQKIGMVLLGGLMFLAIFNDISRVFS